MSESNSMLLYQACIEALLTPGLAEYLDGFYLYGSTPLGSFHIDNWYDGFNVARRTNFYDAMEVQQAESWRLLNTKRSCLNIKCNESSEFLLLYFDDMKHPGVKGLMMDAIGDHPFSRAEPVVFHDDRIIWDPFTILHLREIYTYLTGGQ